MYIDISRTNKIDGMKQLPKRRELTDEEKKESERLNAAWLAYKAENKGATQTWLAAAADLGTQGAVGQYLRGVIPLNLQALLAICQVIGVDPSGVSPRLAGKFKPELLAGLDDLLGDTEKVVRPKVKMIDEVEDAPNPMGKQRWLPVVGVVQAGPDGLLTIDDYPVGQGDGSVPYWAKCENAYALRVRGESMSPRYLPGEFVAVDPCFDVQPSQECIVLKKDGTRMIKRLLWMRDGFASFESINQDYRNITLELEEIEGLHRVLGIIPAFAFKPST